MKQNYFTPQCVQVNPDEFLEEVKKTVRNAVAAVFSEYVNRPARLYTRQQVMDIFHITQPTLDNRIQKGMYRPIRQGGRVYFNADEIDALIAA